MTSQQTSHLTESAVHARRILNRPITMRPNYRLWEKKTSGQFGDEVETRMMTNQSSEEEAPGILREVNQANDEATPPIKWNTINTRFKRMFLIFFIVGLILTIAMIPTLIMTKRNDHSVTDSPTNVPSELSDDDDGMGTSSEYPDQDQNYGDKGGSETVIDRKKDLSIIYYSILSFGLILMIPHFVPLIGSLLRCEKRKQTETNKKNAMNKSIEMEENHWHL
uniref:Uncharacterized protein n=1 Tax=Corethron hystrix TaxID=216773 RepID=A0A7S1BJK5_9STRA|mmetsp:Transcript_30708/g.70276  ORF Transcript_30708/g.70276 Transcript_30708/m.70276 type:complete len:222 (+) Transcript_30708:110-775(+)